MIGPYGRSADSSVEALFPSEADPIGGRGCADENATKRFGFLAESCRGYKYVVNYEAGNPLLCTMKRQRRNEILVEQVVERLRSIRRAQGLTQENVRFDTDLNIGRIESGRHSISLTTLADLCDYYGISLEDFFKEIVTRR